MICRVRRGSESASPKGSKGTGIVMWLHIQMEYCRANLRDVLDRETAAGTEVDEDRAWAWMRQVLEGLAHIHAQGIAHRDLKPGNIFVDARGQLKIGDFGLAKFQDAGGPGGADGEEGGAGAGAGANKNGDGGERVDTGSPLIGVSVAGAGGGGGGMDAVVTPDVRATAGLGAAAGAVTVDHELETTGAVGTYLYTAPEVEAGWVNNQAKSISTLPA